LNPLAGLFKNLDDGGNNSHLRGGDYSKISQALARIVLKPIAITNAAGVPPKLDPPWGHVSYTTLVVSTKDYVLYIDTIHELQWETTPAYDRTSVKHTKFDVAQRNSILSDAAVLEATVRDDFALDVRRELYCLIGNAIACSFEFDYVGAQKAIGNARHYLNERSKEISRFWYLSASFVTALIFIVVGCIAWIARTGVEGLVGPTLMWVGFAAVAGAVGALLSVILRSGKLNFDSSAGKPLHYLEAASRISAGALSGILASLAVKADLLLSAFSHSKSNSVIMLVAFVAGSSERLATSIISKFESAEPAKKVGGSASRPRATDEARANVNR
jgi:hypothetical protein